MFFRCHKTISVHAIYAKIQKNYHTQIFAKENFNNLITFGKQSSLKLLGSILVMQKTFPKTNGSMHILTYSYIYISCNNILADTCIYKRRYEDELIDSSSDLKKVKGNLLMLNISDFLLKVIPWSLCEVSDFLTSSMVTFQDTETRNSKKKIKKHEGNYEKLNPESFILRIQSGNYWDAVIITLTYFFSMSLSDLILSVCHLFKDSKVTSERFSKLCSSTIVLTLTR